MSYESCVLDAEGNCSRWNHDHPPVSNHTPPRAMDFNDGTRVVWYDETHAFAAQQRLRKRFKDEWEDMHRQALLMARISPLSYEQAVDRIIRREQPTTTEAFEEFRRAWAQLVTDVGKAFEPLAAKIAKHLEPPANVMDRALQARKNRNTGPARPSGPSARRPRRHQ